MRHMKVLNLQCEHEHSFEGWFASEADYLSQLGRQLVSCPLCGDVQIQKMLSAPRLNLRSAKGAEPAAAVSSVEPAAAQPNTALQAQFLNALREVMAQTEDVGDRFADEVRGMHCGDVEQRNIRGKTTLEVAMELREEGIDVLPLPDLPGLKETLQ
jgi:hypothetical protein